MLIKRLLCFVLFIISPSLLAQEVAQDKLRITLHTPQSEVESAIVYLSKLPKEDANFIRFFSTYAVPPDKRENVVLTLSFVCHSLVGLSNNADENYGTFSPFAVRNDEGLFIPYKLVPGSDTLWYFDLRDYNWTPEAWEIISFYDAYFAEPIVSHDRNSILRLLSGNAVVRADWFIYHATDNTRQADIEVPVSFYDTLLFANSTKPQNQDEWRKYWGIDINRSRQLGNEYGTLVTKSQIVARHNRMLFGYRSEIGYLYETYDVINQEGQRDYLEALLTNKHPGQPPDVSDAGEMFATNQLGLQVYALRDQNGNLVDFGDPTVVRNLDDITKDARVRTAHSCMDCHATGPLYAENTLKEFIDTGADIYTESKLDANRIRRALLSDKFKESIAINQQLFAQAVKKTNGLSTEENGDLYLQAVRDYDKPLDLDKAAFECGVSAEEFKEHMLKHEYKFGARLKLLLSTGEAVPRSVWESRGKDGIPGAFQQAMIIINGLTLIEETVKIEEEIPVPSAVEATKDNNMYLTTDKAAILQYANINSPVLATTQVNVSVEVLSKNNSQFWHVKVISPASGRTYIGYMNKGILRPHSE